MLTKHRPPSQLWAYLDRAQAQFTRRLTTRLLIFIKANTNQHVSTTNLLPAILPKRRLLQLRLLQRTKAPANLHFRRPHPKMHLSPRLYGHRLRNRRGGMSIASTDVSQWHSLLFECARRMGRALRLRLQCGRCHEQICWEYVSQSRHFVLW